MIKICKQYFWPVALELEREFAIQQVPVIESQNEQEKSVRRPGSTISGMRERSSSPSHKAGARATLA